MVFTFFEVFADLISAIAGNIELVALRGCLDLIIKTNVLLVHHSIILLGITT